MRKSCCPEYMRFAAAVARHRYRDCRSTRCSARMSVERPKEVRSMAAGFGIVVPVRSGCIAQRRDLVPPILYHGNLLYVSTARSEHR